MPIGKHCMPLHSHQHRYPQPQPQGFTLLAVLLALTLLALGSAKVMSLLATQAQREREQELIRIGKAYQTAIGRYYEISPGTVKQWPKSFSDLLDDKRFVGIQRHLRRAYNDPVRRSPEWGIVPSADGGIQGVYSLSTETPLTASKVLEGIEGQAGGSYQSWRFVYQPSSATK
jgi:type II secretory pathway pseudopilin PulG